MYFWKNDRFSLCWDPGGAAVPLETPSPSFFSLEGATLPFLPALLGAILQTGLMGRWPDPTMAIDGRPWQGSRSAAITFSHLYSVDFFPRQTHALRLSESKIQTHLSQEQVQSAVLIFYAIHLKSRRTYFLQRQFDFILRHIIVQIDSCGGKYQSLRLAPPLIKKV